VATWLQYDVFKVTPGVMRRCDRCNHPLRWIRVLTSDRDDKLRVGCCCAKRLVRDCDFNADEKIFEEFFRASRWRTSRNGNPTRKVIVGGRWFWVTIYPFGGGYSGVVWVTEHDARRTGVFGTQDQAKLAVFDLIAELKACLT
jgi:hypothetical protein